MSYNLGFDPSRGDIPFMGIAAPPPAMPANPGHAPAWLQPAPPPSPVVTEDAALYIPPNVPTARGANLARKLALLNPDDSITGGM
jgi:hypothetical protein